MEGSVARKLRLGALAGVLLLYVALLWRTAWLGDDAFLAFRTCDNIVHGWGPRWNVDERVQVFTNPLWTLLVTVGYASTHEIWWTALGLSAAVSGFAVLAIAGRNPSWSTIVGLALLCASRAFVDYSTSGLENPLLHVLLAAHLASVAAPAGDARRPGLACLTAGLLMTTRDDAAVLVVPTVALVLATAPRRRAWSAALAGFAPYLLWKAFAVIYYGFPFPNTAYAKLSTGIPAADLARQGLAYLGNAARWDPITLAGIGAGLGVAAIRRERWMVAAACGVVFHLIYVVRIGGDFMSGRFLSAPLVAAVVIGVRGLAPRLSGRTAMVCVACILAYGAVFPRSPFRAPVDCRALAPEAVRDPHGVTDERSFYHPHTNPHCRRPGVPMPSFEGANWGREQRRAGTRGLVVAKAVGMRAFYGGPALHVLEGWGLQDALLARLPVPPDEPWMIGHFPRAVPDGYLESLATGENRLVDPDVRQYFEALRSVTRGPLFDAGRWRAIWDLNTGRYDRFLARVPSRTNRLGIEAR